MAIRGRAPKKRLNDSLLTTDTKKVVTQCKLSPGETFVPWHIREKL